MKPELENQLCEKFPLLYKDRRGDPRKTLMHWGLSVGDGWYQIIYDLSLKLEILINKYIQENPRICEHCDIEEHLHNIDNACSTFSLKHPKAAQVKEKFGGLRFYMSNGSTKEMEACIDLAEALAGETCEVCGKPGTETDSGWIKIKCDECKASNARTY